MESVFKVPIRNLFCLLSYMNELPDLVKSLNDVDEDLITYDFFAKQFLQEVKALTKRGLVKNYRTISETTGQLGGRILMNESMPYLVAKQPVLVCVKDQYSADTILNRVMKSTLKSLCFNRYVKEETRKVCFSYLELIPEVDARPLTKEVFLKIYFGRHNVHYKRMVHIARLLHEFTLLSHKHGNWSLFTAELNETALNQIFEKFLLNFYKLEQNEYHVQPEIMQWKLEGNGSFLPAMKTDVSLTHKSGKKKIVMDAKFYLDIFKEHFGKASFRSQHLYQLFTYLMHQPQEMDVRGILIYPFNGVAINETFTWNDRMTIEVTTINLDDSWGKIYAKLISILKLTNF